MSGSDNLQRRFPRGLSSHPVWVEFSYPETNLLPLEKDHCVNTTVEHYGNVFVHKGEQES